MTAAEYRKEQTALIKYERECVEKAAREIKERFLIMAKEAFLQGFVDHEALVDGLDAIYHKYKSMAADRAGVVAEQYLNDILESSGLKHVYQSRAVESARSGGDWYEMPDGMRVYVSEARLSEFLGRYQLSADTAPVQMRTMHEETAREMEGQVFAVIEGAMALGRSRDEIKGDLTVLVQYDGQHVIDRWAAKMGVYNPDGSRNERRIKEAWEREYILAVVNEGKSPYDADWIAYPSPEAAERLREPTATMWIQQESIGANGQQLLPPGARRGLSKNETAILNLLVPQKEAARLQSNDRYGDPTDPVSWEEHMRRKRSGWIKYTSKKLGGKNPSSDEIRRVRTKSAIDFNERQRMIAQTSIASTGKVTRKLAIRRDAWHCNCEEAAAWINQDGGKKPEEIPEKYKSPLHPNCDCTDVPVMRPRDEVYDDIHDKYFGELGAEGQEPVIDPWVEVKKYTTDKDVFYGDWSVKAESDLIDPNLFIMGAYVKEEQKKSDRFFKDKVLSNPDTAKAVETYTNDGNDYGHRKINDYMLGKRTLDTEEEPIVKGDIAKLERLANEYELDKDIKVYRGIPLKYFSGKVWETGAPETPKMFTSTSANMLRSWNFIRDEDDPVFMEVRVAKGTKGFYIGDNTFHKEDGIKKNEWEFLLGSGVQYTVISKKDMGGYEYWVVEAKNERP